MLGRILTVTQPDDKPVRVQPICLLCSSLAVLSQCFVLLSLQPMCRSFKVNPAQFRVTRRV